MFYDDSKLGQLIAKISLFLSFLVFITGCTLYLIATKEPGEDEEIEDDAAVVVEGLVYGSPTNSDHIVKLPWFAIGFNDYYRQSDWVGYRLTADRVTNRVCRRTGKFHTDTNLTHSCTPKDYTNSGYDRGHMVPAGDMLWDTNSMHDSFLMSNMSPQHPQLNRNEWRLLEEWVRQVAVKEQSVFVYTGPIFSSSNVVYSQSKAKLPVPDAYYKIIFDETEPKKMIAFILPNCNVTNSFRCYATNVVEVERQTGYDFFKSIRPSTQILLENECSLESW